MEELLEGFPILVRQSGLRMLLVYLLKLCFLLKKGIGSQPNILSATNPSLSSKRLPELWMPTSQ